MLVLVTLAGLEPATSPIPGEQGRSIPPLSYSVVTIFMIVCGNAEAAGIPYCFSILIVRVVVAPQFLQV